MGPPEGTVFPTQVATDVQGWQRYLQKPSGDPCWFCCGAQLKCPSMPGPYGSWLEQSVEFQASGFQNDMYGFLWFSLL